MNIKAGFTPDMLELLKAMKGKTFKSYECTSVGPWGYTDGIVRLNLGRFAIDVTCDLHELDGDPGGYDEMTRLSCREVPLNSEFNPRISAEPRQYLVNEVITGLELVRDHVDDASGECTIDMDMAITIRTKYHTFTFSRDISFDDTIAVRVSDADAPPDGVNPVEEVWPGTDAGAMNVTRIAVPLC